MGNVDNISDSNGKIHNHTEQSPWKTPENLLLIMTCGLTLSFACWQTLLNNFAIEKVAFTGEEIGILQSLREIPGFLALTAIIVLLIIKEQSFAMVALAITGIGVAITGYFPSALGLYCTTVVMSIGFHYFETMQQSLALQWFPKKTAAQGIGRLMASRSAAALLVYLLIWIATGIYTVPYKILYLVGGVSTVAIALFVFYSFPKFTPHTPQHKKVVLRKEYWLYYLLVFMSGARRQIFVVFAGFLMVEKFGFSVATIAMLFFSNHAINMFAAPIIGTWISRVGERRALVVEYLGLIIIFTTYAFVENPYIAGGLYIIDHLLFSMAIAIKTYFQKIADPKDISATAAISFSINHIAAVFIPALFGLIWLYSSSLVFILGAGMAALSLLLAINVPNNPNRQQIAHLWGNRPSSASTQ